MPDYKIVWEYQRVPGTALYNGFLQLYQDSRPLDRKTYLGMDLRVMVAGLHQMLQGEESAAVDVVLTTPASQFHEERRHQLSLSNDLVCLIRDNLSEAMKKYEPVIIRSEESNASQG